MAATATSEGRRNAAGPLADSGEGKWRRMATQLEKKVRELQGKMQQKAAVVHSQLTHPPIADLDVSAERRGRYLELYKACSYALLHTTGAVLAR